MQSIVVALISAAVSITLAVLGYMLTKKRDREADWRKKKLEMYHKLFDAISGIVVSDATAEGQRAFAKACNTVGLIAPTEVIVALQRFQACTKPEHLHEQDQALTYLLRAVRRDLGLPLKNDENLTYKLWASGADKQKAKQ